MNIIYKTTFRKDGNLNLYKVEKLSNFNSYGYTEITPYFGGLNKYKKWEYEGFGISKFIKRDSSGNISEEVIIRNRIK